MTGQPKFTPQISPPVVTWLQTRRDPHSPIAQACETYCQARYRQEFGRIGLSLLRELQPWEREPPPGIISVTQVRRGVERFVREFQELLIPPYAGTSLSMHFNRRDEEGRRYRERTLGGKTYRYYADQGRRLGSVWTDCSAMRANTPLVRETTGYPTQKPEKLLERIVRAASLPSSRVLDPMCGSGTTLAVADRLGRRWVGIDMSPTACETSRNRLCPTNLHYDKINPASRFVVYDTIVP